MISGMCAAASVATSLPFLGHPRHVPHLRTFVLAGPSSENALSLLSWFLHFLQAFSLCLLVENFLATLSKISLPPLPVFSVPFPCPFSLAIIITQHTLVAQMVRICLQRRRPRFNPWVGKTPWRRAWKPSPVFLPGESQGQRSLVDYGP